MTKLKNHCKNGQFQIAKYKEKGKLVDLTVDNADKVIKYLSLTTGTIKIDSICISGFGISLMCYITEMHICPYPKDKKQRIKTEDVDSLREYGIKPTADEDNDEDDDDEDDDEDFTSKPPGKSVNKTVYKSSSVEEEFLNDNQCDEPNSNSDSDEEPTVKKTKTPSPKKKNKVDKVIKPTPVKLTPPKPTPVKSTPVKSTPPKLQNKLSTELNEDENNESSEESSEESSDTSNKSSPTSTKHSPSPKSESTSPKSKEVTPVKPLVKSKPVAKPVAKFTKKK